MLEYIITFMVSVLANVVSYYICKWSELLLNAKAAPPSDVFPIPLDRVKFGNKPAN
ncbi:MAG: hypothetical protein LUD77_00955 [Clostridiales bacterium]|nr:hypothetical protein [Clostridiales bacterium]